MTVKELIEAAPFCDSAEIVVRENGSGHWIQGYRIGKNIEMFPCEFTIELQESLGHEWQKHVDGRSQPYLTKGEIRDVYHAINLPMKLIKKDVTKLPDSVANLEVSSFQPRHIPSFHREALTHNDFLLEINAYPDGYVPEKEVRDKTDDNLEGQMTIFDLEEM